MFADKLTPTINSIALYEILAFIPPDPLPVYDLLWRHGPHERM